MSIFDKFHALIHLHKHTHTYTHTQDEFYASVVESGSAIKAVIIDASGVLEVDLSALAVIDEMVAEMQRQDIEVFIASASARVVKSLVCRFVCVCVCVCVYLCGDFSFSPVSASHFLPLL
jgi:anti-anti-sigma regulatory factor